MERWGTNSRERERVRGAKEKEGAGGEKGQKLSTQWVPDPGPCVPCPTDGISQNKSEDVKEGALEEISWGPLGETSEPRGSLLPLFGNMKGLLRATSSSRQFLHVPPRLDLGFEAGVPQ